MDEPKRDEKSRRNAGETFSEEHQQQYEAMEKQSRPDLPEDLAHQVPRLADVLTKRRRIANPKLIQLDRAPPKKILPSERNKIASSTRDDPETPHYDSKCDACRNLKCLEILQRLDLKPPCPRSKKVSNQRVEKYMNHRQQKAGRKSRHRQTFRAINKKDLKRITRQCIMPRSLSKPSKDTVRSRADKSNYSIKTIYPDSKNPSVTSYHSFGSMSQEPMV